MRKDVGLGAVVLSVGLGLLAAACSGSSKTNPGSDGCKPGTVECDGNEVVVCDESGDTRTLQVCNGACSQGACVDGDCVPNTKFCKDGAVWKCDGSGEGRLAESCAGGTTCRMDDTSAECSAHACVPGEPTCDGDRASKCKPDGSGAEPGGMDCAEANQLCYQGQCRDQACTPGEKVCQQGDVYLCANSGTATSLLAECSAEDVCDGLAGACRPRVCDPGKIACDSARVVQCNEFGSGWGPTVTDCAADGNICVDGVCQKQVCNAGATFCQEDDVYQCNASGTGAILWQSCYPGSTRCQDYVGSNFAHCAYYECTPSQVFCDGNWVRKCTADGDIPAEGQDCGPDNYCENGTCKPRTCKPYEYSCKDGDVWYCDDWGRQTYLAYECHDETVCQANSDGGGATCVVLPCLPGTTDCLANKIGTCGEDGSTLATVTEDCATAGTVCTATKTCAASAQDVLGAENELTTFESGMAVGNAVKVTSARTVTELEASLVLVAARDLRWVIFEETAGAFVARVDKVVGNQKGSDYFSSGPLDYTLKAGKSYLFAVVVTGGSFGAVYDLRPWSSDVSFGTGLGGYPFYYASSVGSEFYTEQLFQMRITTELP